MVRVGMNPNSKEEIHTAREGRDLAREGRDLAGREGMSSSMGTGFLFFLSGAKPITRTKTVWTANGSAPPVEFATKRSHLGPPQRVFRARPVLHKKSMVVLILTNRFLARVFYTTPGGEVRTGRGHATCFEHTVGN